MNGGERVFSALTKRRFFVILHILVPFYMKRLYPLVSVIGYLFLFAFKGHAQVISLGPDDTICPGQNLTLNASLYYPSGSPPAPTTITFCGFGTCDDYLSSTWIPLGFTFNFYGNNYTQCLVSSNGYITFTGAPGAGSPWSIGANAPSGAVPLNSIMAPWQDLYPGLGGLGTARYKTIGTAPNRKFILEYLNVPSFSCSTATCYGAQIHLFEGSNIIETHIFRYEPCTGWNNGRGIHGIQNAAGTIAHIVPGRNGLSAPWRVNVPGFTVAPNSAGPEGRRWTPTSSTNYTITTVPFAPIYMPNTAPAPASISWFANGTPMGTGTSMNVSPTVNTTYVVSVPYSSCNGTVLIRDTMRVVMGSVNINTSGNTNMCNGDTISISANATGPGTMNYTWSPGTGLSATNVNNPQAFPTTTTTYTVTATNGACSSSTTLTVTVYSIPSPVITGPPEYCQGGNVVLSTTTPYSQYNWSNGISTATNTVTQGNYTVTVTDANGCIATSLPFSVIENPNPVPVITGPNIYCQGSNATLSTTQPYAQYSWSNGPTTATNTVTQGNYSVTVTDTNNCVGTSALFNVSEVILTPAITGMSIFCLGDSIPLNVSGGPYASYTWSTGATTPSIYALGGAYSVTVSDVNGCTATANANAPSSPNPVAQFNVNVGNCFGQATNFTDASTITSGTIVGWQWDFNGGGNSSQQNPTYTFGTTGTQNVTLTVTSNDNCTNAITLPVEIYPLPQVNFTAPAINGCEPVTVNFQNLTTITTGSITSYSWTFEGNGSSNAQDPSVTYPNDGLFDVSLTAVSDMGCVNSLTMPDMVHIYNVPTAGFFPTPPTTTVGDPTITFVNTSSGDVAIWDWDFAGLGTSGFSDPTFDFTVAGDYLITLIVETQYGCGDTTTGSVHIDDLSEIWIPNSFTPNEDGLNDTWFPVGRNLNTPNLYIEVHVFNRWGTRVFRSTSSDKPWNGKDQNFDEDCPSGVYSYRVIFVNEQGKEKKVMGHINLIR